jgi:hypothetical protein
VKGNSASTAKELAEHMDIKEKIKMQYGARRIAGPTGEGHCVYEVDLWKRDGFVDGFPEGEYQ